MSNRSPFAMPAALVRAAVSRAPFGMMMTIMTTTTHMRGADG
jgi:hypothetical protein